MEMFTFYPKAQSTMKELYTSDRQIFFIEYAHLEGSERVGNQIQPCISVEYIIIFASKLSVFIVSPEKATYRDYFR